jgi:hypothetical protein
MERGRLFNVEKSGFIQHSNKFKKIRHGLKHYTGYASPEREKEYKTDEAGIVTLSPPCPRAVYQKVKKLLKRGKHGSRIVFARN